MKVFLLLILTAFLFAAAPKRNWRVGTLVEAAETREVAGTSTSGGGVFGPAPPLPQGQSVAYATLQGYVIRGDDMVYMVQMRLKTTGHIHRTEVRPNVTVKGPINYAFEKGKFYIQDEDGNEFEMAVMQKRLLTDDEKKLLTRPTKPQ